MEAPLFGTDLAPFYYLWYWQEKGHASDWRPAGAAVRFKHPLEDEKCSDLIAGRGGPERAAKLLRNCLDLRCLPGKLVFAQLFQAVAEAALQRSGSIGVERDEVPERLAAILA